MLSKILIANRGEIACRVSATARRMGIKTVAVYSDADAGAAHVAACDEAVRLGPPAARESYLLGDKIIAAALATGAQAIHPGYGFLSENAAFAAACEAAGLTFIGPPASAIRAMGSKSAAKSLMEKAGVPLVPGYHGDDQDPALLHREADRIGYPVLLKASAGGGGKGMRVVERSDDFSAALASCKREAASSFGDDKVLLERYLQRPRHIEIQVFADTQGECVFLFERDCSVQRRHQKVLEEAPAPGMTEARRAAMGAAAVAAARAVGYVGAGTVEFITEDEAFYFMEMNTRLQVEHPVTEMITGQDLVEWQLRVASGEPLPLGQSQLAISGHAIEARIYAENPEKGFLPSIGTLLHLHTPPAVAFMVSATHSSAGAAAPAAVRIDSGVRSGDTISPYYDPMIAKLIVWGPDRASALARMSDALAAYQVVGPATNTAFLRRLVDSVPFSTADLDTGLIERNQAALFPPVPPATLAQLALACAVLLRDETATLKDDGNPWAATSGWRLQARLERAVQLDDAQQAYALSIGYGGGSGSGFSILHGDTATALHLLPGEGAEVAVRLGDDIVRGTVVREGEAVHVFHAGSHVTLRYADPMAHAGVAEVVGGRLTAPMPGKIVAVLVAAGDAVEAGAPLVIMEAMKMEHTIAAPRNGVVEALLYAVGDQVADGAPLLSFKDAA
ncbi:MAG: acetyl/propionyl/methylcrotonyl-CoA carboxylase subunit alpha [Herminiimonas sp.]|nr:acetyl/propionyl/methylcrotonyl-CoA carboxylase subunit alpha [Herminiimonas sp.]